MEGEEINIDLTNTNLAPFYRHAFTQINNSATIITKWVESSPSLVSGKTIVTATAETGSALLQCTAMSFQQLKSNLNGFNITAKSAEKIVEIFKTSQVIPSQILDYNAFSVSATRSGIQSTINMPITNCTCISISYSRTNR